MAGKIRTVVTAAFAALATAFAGCDKTDEPKVRTAVDLPAPAVRQAVDPAKVTESATTMSKGIIDSMRPLVNGVDDGVAGVGRYTASALNIPKEMEYEEISMRFFSEQPGSRLHTATRNAMETGRVQVYGAGLQMPGEKLSRFEYAGLVYPTGGGQIIVRQFMGDMNNPQLLSDNAVLNNNGLLAKHGVAPLRGKEPGYRTIFAADIDAKGAYKVLPNPEKLDISAYGIDNAFSPAPREPVDARVFYDGKPVPVSAARMTAAAARPS